MTGTACHIVYPQYCKHQLMRCHIIHKRCLLQRLQVMLRIYPISGWPESSHVDVLLRNNLDSKASPQSRHSCRTRVGRSIIIGSTSCATHESLLGSVCCHPIVRRSNKQYLHASQLPTDQCRHNLVSSPGFWDITTQYSWVLPHRTPRQRLLVATSRRFGAGKRSVVGNVQQMPPRPWSSWCIGPASFQTCEVTESPD